MYLKYKNVSRKTGKFFILFILRKFWQITYKKYFDDIVGTFVKIMDGL